MYYMTVMNKIGLKRIQLDFSQKQINGGGGGVWCGGGGVVCVCVCVCGVCVPAVCADTF
jgi:hypothetical protein